MAVLRIVANIPVADPGSVRDFYEGVLGLDRLMDQGWIVTYGSEAKARAQVSFATEGGSGTPVPDLSIEVDDLDGVHQRVLARGFEVIYGIADEPWGVRRFFVRDPAGRIVNILQHLS